MFNYLLDHNKLREAHRREGRYRARCIIDESYVALARGCEGQKTRELSRREAKRPSIVTPSGGICVSTMLDASRERALYL